MGMLHVCVATGRAGNLGDRSQSISLEEGLCLGFTTKLSPLMGTGVKLRVMKRYCARGYWNNLHIELLVRPVDVQEPCSISTVDNKKAK